MLLNPNMITKLLHHPPLSREEPLNSKTTFLVKCISGKADLVGQIAAYVFVEYFHERGVAVLVSLCCAWAGSIIAM
jgi:hypothetical protein